MRRARSWSHLGKNVVIALSLVAAGFFVAWLRFRPHLTTQSAFSDGTRRYQGLATEPVRFAVWDEIETILGGTESREAEHKPTISLDGRWLVFVSGERGLSADLWIGEVVEGEVEELRPLYELNTSFDEMAPAFGEDALYFSSNRPGGAGGFDLWRAPFSDGELGEAEILGDGVNGARDDTDPAPLPESGALAFASNRRTAGRRGHDLFLARPGAEGDWTVEPLEGLNSLEDDREPAFTRDGRRIVFASDREGDRGSFDLFGSLHDLGAWLPPTPLDGLNSAASERAPAPIGDGFSMLFELEEEGAGAALCRVRSLELFPHPGPEVGWLDLVILITLLVLALLAWLAKRWEAIEILYKCFLVSVIAHGFLLWWFRGIHPEAEIEALPSGEPAFEVRLAASGAKTLESQRERGGEVEADARRLEAETSPAQRHQVEEPRRAPAKAGATRTVARAESRPAPLPTRSEETPAPSRQAAEVPPTKLADAAQAVVLNERGAPALELEVGSASPPRSRPNGEASEPVRGSHEARSAPVPRPSGANAGISPRQEVDTLPTPGSNRVVSAELPDELAVTTKLRGPEETYVRRRESAAGLELSAAELATLPDSRDAAEPLRAEPLELVPRSTPSKTPPARPHVAAVSEDLAPPPYQAWESSPTEVVPGPRIPLRAPEDAGPPRATIEPSPKLASAELQPSLPLSKPSSVARSTSTPPVPLPSRLRIEPSRATVTPSARRVPTAPRIVDATEETRPADPFEHTPYRARFGLAKVRALEEHGGSVETEAAVASGLAYLATRQHDQGYWGDPDHYDEKYGYVLVGKSALAQLAYLGAGHTQVSETEYSDVVERAVEFLLAVQGDDSGHFGGTAAYGHGIATYALAENYALTRDERLREPLARAVAQILRHQNGRRRDPRRFGGWSYFYPTDRTYDSWPRVSITAWQVMALESARQGGLEVPPRALDDARTFLLAALDEQRGCFRYCHDPSRLNSSYPILPGSTPAALFALSLLGEDLRDERFDEPIDFVLQRVPRGYRYDGDGAFVSRARGNLYFWYYGCLAMLRRGGKIWARWNEGVKETLLESQRSDGSWKPISIYAEYAADTGRDSVYTTAMCVLSLEVYYRYFTPMLESGDPAERLEDPGAKRLGEAR